MSLDDPAIQRAFAEASEQQYLLDPNSAATPGSAPGTTITQPQSPTESAERNEIWTRPAPKPRGRAPNDPNGKKVTFRCQTMEDLESNLREYLNTPLHAPEHTTLEFHYGMEAAFLVAKVHLKAHMTAAEAHNAVFSEKTVVSVLNALSWSQDPREMKYKQRAIAKACAEAIMRVDQYKYSYNNEWVSKEDQASRISYYCNDSTSNKMRSINAAKPNQGKRAGKPVYDCHGYIAIKFSAVKQNLEISYKHIPIHKTYDERAPAPRRGSKRRRLMEMYDPEALPSLRRETPNKGPLSTVSRTEGVTPTLNRSRSQHKNHKPRARLSPNDTANGLQDAFERALDTDGAHASQQPYPTPPPRSAATAPRNYPLLQPPDPRPNSFQNPPHSPSQPQVQPQVQPQLLSQVPQTHFPGSSTGISTVSASRPARSSRPAQRQTTAQKRASTLSATRSEIDLMRGRLAEAEALVQQLEAEEVQNDNRNRSQNRGKGQRGQASEAKSAWTVFTPTTYPQQGMGAGVEGSTLGGAGAGPGTAGAESMRRR